MVRVPRSRDRDALDEIRKLKDDWALGGRHNLRLASKAWAAEAIHVVGASFAAAVALLGASPELTLALQRSST